MQKSEATFTHLQRVDSTNNYAMGKVHAGMAIHGDAYFTMEQTQGKGQRGKQWMGGNAENIAISIVIKPSVLPISQQFALSAAVAVGTHFFFSRYAGDETSIKWPNDIYWRDRKAAGILIENIIGQPYADGKTPDDTVWKFAIAGIGVNINQTKFDLTLNNAVSLKQLTGKQFNCITLANQLHQCVIAKVDEVLAGNFTPTYNYYNEHLYKKNKRVILRKDTIEFETLIQSVSTSGQLLTTDIIDNQFNFGEIEWAI
jgi:BirA family biotin operon repressor/biotin-[acetyl-CoA-carboxylase] ligase